MANFDGTSFRARLAALLTGQGIAVTANDVRIAVRDNSNGRRRQLQPQYTVDVEVVFSDSVGAQRGVAVLESLSTNDSDTLTAQLGVVVLEIKGVQIATKTQSAPSSSPGTPLLVSAPRPSPPPLQPVERPLASVISSIGADEPPSSSSDDTGAIVGGVLGGLASIALVALLAVGVRRRRQSMHPEHVAQLAEPVAVVKMNLQTESTTSACASMPHRASIPGKSVELDMENVGVEFG